MPFSSRDGAVGQRPHDRVALRIADDAGEQFADTLPGDGLLHRAVDQDAQAVKIDQLTPLANVAAEDHIAVDFGIVVVPQGLVGRCKLPQQPGHDLLLGIVFGRKVRIVEASLRSLGVRHVAEQSGGVENPAGTEVCRKVDVTGIVEAFGFADHVVAPGHTAVFADEIAALEVEMAAATALIPLPGQPVGLHTVVFDAESRDAELCEDGFRMHLRRLVHVLAHLVHGQVAGNEHQRQDEKYREKAFHIHIRIRV